MPRTGWEAYSAWLLAQDVQEFGCTIHEHDCELRWNLNDGRLWLGIAASSIVLGFGVQHRGRFHLTILTASGVVCSPAPEQLERLERSLKKSLSSTPVLVAGDPDPILDPRTDLPHRVIVTLNVRSALHTKLFGARTTFLQQVACGRPDDRTSFHLSIDYFDFRPGYPGYPAGIDSPRHRTRSCVPKAAGVDDGGSGERRGQMRRSRHSKTRSRHPRTRSQQQGSLPRWPPPYPAWRARANRPSSASCRAMQKPQQRST